MDRAIQVTWTQKLGIGVVIAFIFAIVIIFSHPIFRKFDLRYERGPYSVLEDQAVTSCVIKNRGYDTVKKARMFVEFESRILDINVSPKSAGRLIEISLNQNKAIIDLESIVPNGEVVIFFSVEQPQEEPFDIRLIDISPVIHG